MKRDRTLLEKRAEYVKNYINKSINSAKAVEKMSQRFCVTVKTIYEDLKK